MIIDYYCPPATSEWDDPLAQIESCDECAYPPLRREIDEYIVTLDELEFPKAHADKPAPKRSLTERFREQSDIWAHDTRHLSSPNQMMMHPSYQAILGMAQEDRTQVIRLLLTDLKANRRMWFWALSYLTQENPVKASDAGNLNLMIKAWTEWAQKKGVI